MASFVFISCEKSTGALGLDLVVEDKAVLGVKRTIPIILSTRSTDSINTTKPGRHMAGYMSDNVFGASKNSFVTQLKLSQTQPDFGDNGFCDSAFLVMYYAGYYGDTNTIIKLDVHELDEELKDTIYSNETYLTSNLLGEETFMPRPNTFVPFQDTLLFPSTVVNIDPNWVNNKIIFPAIAGDPAFESNEEFLEYFNGIQVSPSNTGNCTPYYDMNDARSFLRIFYREDPSDTVSKTFDLYAELGMASGNLSEFDYSMAEFDLDNQDTVDGEYKLYLQSMAGVETLFDLKALETYKDSAFLINKAELIFNVEAGSATQNKPPDRMLLLEERNGIRIFITDYSDNLGHDVGGRIEYDFLREGKYVFNITRQIHKYLNTDSDINDLVMIPANSAINMNRAILGGQKNLLQPAEFNIYFTRTK